MERLRGDLREHARGGVRGHIRLISNTTALEEYLPDVLAGWLATNPGVDIALEERLSYEIAPAIAQDLLDEEFVGLVAGSALAEHLAWQSTRLGRSLRPRIDYEDWMPFAAWWSPVWGLPSCRKRPLCAVGEPWRSARFG
jgi:DNA-binding transcriptional LysR family regulator